jgi:hypothetical protein
MFCFWRPAIATQPAPFQRRRICRLQAWSAQQSEFAADLRKLFFRDLHGFSGVKSDLFAICSPWYRSE